MNDLMGISFVLLSACSNCRRRRLLLPVWLELPWLVELLELLVLLEVVVVAVAVVVVILMVVVVLGLLELLELLGWLELPGSSPPGGPKNVVVVLVVVVLLVVLSSLQLVTANTCSRFKVVLAFITTLRLNSLNSATVSAARQSKLGGVVILKYKVITAILVEE